MTRYICFDVETPNHYNNRMSAIGITVILDKQIMHISRNPARSRPLSKNVKRLMKMAREPSGNQNVIKAERTLSERDLAYCDLQGEIFMSAVDLGYPLEEFTPVFMNSQLAGVIDYSFSASEGMENDRLSALLKIPLLIKSPEKIAALAMWLDEVSGKITGDSALAIMQLCEEAENTEEPPAAVEIPLDSLTKEYEYAYWLGYIYRCECLMHVESSRMVYGAFPEQFMRETYGQMIAGMGGYDIEKTAPEICRRIDLLLAGKLWNEENPSTGRADKTARRSPCGGKEE